MLRLAVTGANGQVATALGELAPARGVELVAVHRPDLDLARPDTVLAALRAAEPDVVVSAAAFTAVDRAESESELAFAVNAAGAGAVAAAAAELAVPVIHLSSDYVFDGTLSRPYDETDPPAPLNVYGASKLAGERKVARANNNHAILRTAWVYGPVGRNFLLTMQRLAGERGQVCVVEDQFGNPTSALDIADAVVTIAGNLKSAPDDAGLRGVFHLAGGGEASWADFAEAIMNGLAARGRPYADVKRIQTSQYPTAAKRPANSRLDCAKVAERHGVRLPDWRRSTAMVIERVAGAGPGRSQGVGGWAPHHAGQQSPL